MWFRMAQPKPPHLGKPTATILIKTILLTGHQTDMEGEQVGVKTTRSILLFWNSVDHTLNNRFSLLHIQMVHMNCKQTFRGELCHDIHEDHQQFVELIRTFHYCSQNVHVIDCFKQFCNNGIIPQLF